MNNQKQRHDTLCSCEITELLDELVELVKPHDGNDKVADIIQTVRSRYE